MNEYLKQLMKTLEARRIRTAIEDDKPVLVRVVIAGKHKLIHPQNFVEALEEQEQVIDPTTLEIIDYEELVSIEDLRGWGISEETILRLFPKAPEQPPEPPVTEPTGITPPVTVPEVGTPPDATKDNIPADGSSTIPQDEIPPIVETPPEVWSEAELIMISKQEDGYNKLRAISKLYDDIPGNISKDALIEKISGKAKP